MVARVIDTNVIVGANGRGTHLDEVCQLACVNEISAINDGAVVLLDSLDHILEEYTPYCNHSGEPGVGDALFVHLRDHKYTDSKCIIVEIHTDPTGVKEYVEFPDAAALVAFDRSDRKFVAVAKAFGAAHNILCASDRGWVRFQAALQAEDISVTHICTHM